LGLFILAGPSAFGNFPDKVNGGIIVNIGFPGMGFGLNSGGSESCHSCLWVNSENIGNLSNCKTIHISIIKENKKNVKIYSNRLLTNLERYGTMFYVGDTNMVQIFAHVPDEWKGHNPIMTPDCGHNPSMVTSVGSIRIATPVCDSNPNATTSKARKSQNMLCISEQGLYFFLGRSDKPKALPFQKWLAGEVLPSLRKTGTYTVPGREKEDPFFEWKKNHPYPFFVVGYFGDIRRSISVLFDNGSSKKHIEALQKNKKTGEWNNADKNEGSNRKNILCLLDQD
jgi:hypothetical protein